jgi:micrococcal nuclease
MNRFSVFLVAFILGGLAVYANALDIFSWKDENGGTHFSDQAAPGAERLRVDHDGSPARPDWAVVKSVYDGDTITLENGDKVRLLGINTPEIDGGYRRGEAGGQEAKAWLTQKILGRKVRLE